MSAAPQTAVSAPAKKAPITAAARPLISVRKVENGAAPLSNLLLPAVFLAPIRPDIVHFVHTNMAKNARQAYAVSAGAGHQHSAHSWGTGRAVARIPRVSGGGTSRSGQGAFGNMCRSGRMFAPTKTWRKWHRKINTNQKRYAVASALAASALPGLVFARGHAIAQVPEIPLVVDNALQSIAKTKQAIAALQAVGAFNDVLKVKNSRKLRAGKGKLRNRRYVQRRGPLVVYHNDDGLVKAFRNLPGVETASVNALNLLQLAPGGHLGRFIIWTQDAFDALNGIYGSFNRVSAVKKNYHLPRGIVTISDLPRIINSDEVQSKVRPVKRGYQKRLTKKNPLTNLGARIKLNPYAAVLRRGEVLAAQRRAALKAGQKPKVHAHQVKALANKKAAQKKHRPTQAKIYKNLIAAN